jgi:hypothetical protein
MDHEFLPSAGETTLDVLKRQARPRDELLKRLFEDPNRPRLEQTLRYNALLPVFRRWVWGVENTTTGKALAWGKAPTRAAAIRRRFRAYRKALAELHTEQEETP